MQLGRCAVHFGFLLVVFISACGKVGDPLPPFIRIPEAIKDLNVAQSGYNLVLTWTNPPRYIDGSAATNLSRVQIRSNWTSAATVEAAAAGRPQSYSIPVGPVNTSERTFWLVVETTQGKLSEVSNKASITPVEVPGRVGRLTAMADQRRIFLQWDKPQDRPDLADAYVVTRTDIPAEAQTLTDTRYEDLRYESGKMFTYHVTATRRLGQTMVMGVGPEATSVVAQDKTPPKVPTGLEISSSDAGGYVTWNPNNEADLAGYRVFRSDRSNAGFKPVSDRIVM